jgi:hypothetical protein
MNWGTENVVLESIIFMFWSILITILTPFLQRSRTGNIKQILKNARLVNFSFRSLKLLFVSIPVFFIGFKIYTVEVIDKVFIASLLFYTFLFIGNVAFYFYVWLKHIERTSKIYKEAIDTLSKATLLKHELSKKNS